MDDFLHACTPGRLGAWAQTSTLLGNAPAGTLPNTRTALTLDASSLVSSLLGVGISACVDQGSGIFDLSSPNAKRLTSRPCLALSALRSSSSINHNRLESIILVTLDYRSSKLALQAASQPIHENASCRNGLIDGSSHLVHLQKRLSGASNGIPCLLVYPYTLAIHNYQLSMCSRDFYLNAILQAALSLCAHLNRCYTDVCWRVGNRKMCNIFSVFNRKKTEPYTDEFVKRVHDLDKLICIWYVLAPRYSLACSLNAAPCIAVAKQPRRPASKPGVFKYREIRLVRLLSWFHLGLSVVLVLAVLLGRKQGPGDCPTARSSFVLNWLPAYSQAASLLLHFVTHESEVFYE